MVVMDQYTRRIIGFAIHAGNVDGPDLCRMFNDATSKQGWAKWHDPCRVKYSKSRQYKSVSMGKALSRLFELPIAA
jgi:hypothetical protein